MRSGSGPPTPGFRALDPSDFSFHGFGDLRHVVERRIRSVGIRSGEPAVSVVEGAVFVPSENVRSAGRSKAFGGLVTADGRPIDSAGLRRKGRIIGGRPDQPVAVTPRREVDEDVVYLGPLFNHFGRVLLESLARVWYLSEVDPSVRVVFDHPNPAQRTPAAWTLRLLEAFGIPLARILVLDTPTRLRRAIVPEPLFEQLYAAHEAMIEPYRRVAARIAGDVEPSAQPVYLSRRLLTSRQRPIIGEDQLEEVLRESGFRIAHPQTMPFEDQIRLINGHADIVSSVGSAAHNVLFALGRPALHLLTNGPYVSPNYCLCSALAGVPTTLVNCLGTGGRPSLDEERQGGRGGRRGGDPQGAAATATGTQATPLFAELPKILDYLDERGWATPRSRAALPSRDAALQDQYDEAWFCARVRKATAKRGTELPTAVEDEAVRLAARSWPVSFMLARVYAVRQDASRADAMANQFAELAAAETDPNRLAYYRAEVPSTATRVARICTRETADRLTRVVADRFVGSPQTEDTGPIDGP